VSNICWCTTYIYYTQVLTSRKLHTGTNLEEMTHTGTNLIKKKTHTGATSIGGAKVRLHN